MQDGYKVCGKCGDLKPLCEFYKKLDKKSSKCIPCTKDANNKYRLLHKDDLNKYRRNYYIANKDSLIKYGLDYRADLENKKLISKNKKLYLDKNRSSINVQKNKRRKIRRDTDPAYKLRNLISRAVSRMLKLSSSNKNGSIKDNLLYSIDELKDYLEKLFEPWMTWKNQGVYNAKIWDDNDQSTWTWQLDHIIPQSDLPYISMQDENFKKCWGLENLRPLSAKQNILDGVNHRFHRSKYVQEERNTKKI